MDNGLKKVSFISIIIGGIFFIIILTFYLAYSYLSKDFYDIFILVCIGVFIFIFVLYFISFFVILSAYNIKNINKKHAILAINSLKVTRPLIVLIAEIFKFNMEYIRHFFIAINNILISSLNLKFDKEDVLVLLPHCLQNYECNVKLKGDIERCKDCGRCCLSEIKKICKKYDVRVAIVTGGTAARNIVKKFRPKVIVSVACERDLLSGIIDVGSIPVLGIINDRPEGPCYNTSVGVDKLDSNLKKVLKN